MSLTIDQSLVIQFGEMVHVLADQAKSRMKGRVLEQSVRGNEFTYERLSSVQAVEVTTRHADTVAQDIAHSRRGGKMRDFRATLMLDHFDDLQVLIDPSREYASAVAEAMMRQYDYLCLTNALGSVNTGRKLDVPVDAVTDGVLTVAANGTGLTFEKLNEIQQNFIDNEVGLDRDEELYLCITGQQHADLLKETELTSGDYTAGGRGETVIDRGRITKAMGMNIIVFGANASKSMLSKTSTTRHCIAFAKSGIVVGMNKDISIDIDKRPDKNNAWQVQASIFMDAIRTEGVKVQQVDCVES